MSIIDIEEYHKHLKYKETAKNTIRGYLTRLRQLNEYCIDNNIKELSKDTMIDYKEYLNEKYTNVDTINNKLIIIISYLNWKYGRNEAELIKPKLLKKQNKTHREYLTFKEFKRILENTDLLEIQLFILVIANTGLRISEVTSLKKRDLDSKKIKITNKGKSRKIGVPYWLKKKLEDYFSDKEDNEYLFAKSQQYYRIECKRSAGRANVKKERVYPHALRHLFSKEWISKTGDISTLQQMLGHSNINTTAIYTKLNEDELTKAFTSQKNR